MKHILFFIVLVVLNNWTNAQGIKESQSLWEIEEPYGLHFFAVGMDTSVNHLKQIVLDPESPSLDYNSAVLFLVLNSDINLRQFLLNNMISFPHKTNWIDSNFVWRESWDKYFTDQKIKGFLGLQSAIIGMDSVARFHPNRLERIVAVRLLSRVGRLDYFDFIKSCYLDGLDGNIDSFISDYGKDNRFSLEVKTLLTNTIRDSTDSFKIFSAASFLASIDKPYTISVMEEKFRNTSGYNRYRNYFFELGRLDPEGQMNRTIYAIQNEQEDSIKELFLPSFLSEFSTNIDPKYYSPYFIDFLKHQIENGFDNEFIIYNFKHFKPIRFDSSSYLLDDLIFLNEIIDSVKSYYWLADLAFSSELKNILTTAKTNLQVGDSLACRVQVKAFQDLVDNVYKDSLNTDPRFVTIEGWKFLYWNAQYILDRLPEPPANPNLVVSLKNSLGNQMPASNVMYYEGSWKDAVNNGDGTFTVITTRPTVSIRVFYEGANQTVNNVPAQNNTYTFTTVNAAVQLKNSLGNLIDVGTVQYYAGAWRSFGTTSNGVVYKELLPINYSFRMTYEYSSIDKQQDISTNTIVVFQTVNAAVQLKNSLGNLIDIGTVQYYAGAWRSFGTTSNGVAYKELLPINYSFRMTYEYVSKDKQQNLSTNPVMDFSTVLCSVKVSNANNNQPINNADVKYYAGAWRNLGTTNSAGIATKELLPANLSFRATLGNVSQDKQQDISVNSLVEILLNVP